MAFSSLRNPPSFPLTHHLFSPPMKAGTFEMVHGGVLDMIQHQHHEYYLNPSTNSSLIPVQTSMINQFPKPVNNELSDWVEQITKQLIDDPPEITACSSLETFQAATTTSSDDNYFVQSASLSGDYFRPRKIPRIELANTNTNSSSSNNNNNNNDLDDQEQNLTQMMTLLLECAVAISVDNLGEAHRMILELTQITSPYAPSSAERVVAYFSKAMASRVVNSWLGIVLCSPYPLPLVNHKSLHDAFQAFNNVSPFVKFAHFTSNQAILESFHRRDRLHVIDLDIMQGLQWPALFHILATRAEGPPSHVRITGVGSSPELLSQTGQHLSSFAKRLGINSFEFHPVVRDPKSGLLNVGVSTFRVRRGETLAVHWLRHCLYDSTGPEWRTIRLVEELKPRIFTLVEQDFAQSGSFLDRFVGSLHYYSTMFDSLGAYLGADDPNRHTVEHCLLHREINNMLAIGGPGRSGEEKLRDWRSELVRRSSGGGGGLEQVAMSGNCMAQAQLILNMFSGGNSGYGYSLVQGNDGTLRLGWKDTCLYTASAWTTSSTYNY
ncbi:protein SCARECROW-like [Humulus lupulus]|uniref:protein SCARECROW-like n=1 Tax=Humulus lupulus TaxID=3486 RepID=UPI002B40E36C|nr:protein SCARECROW-like [Humulus lupulus]